MTAVRSLARYFVSIVRNSSGWSWTSTLIFLRSACTFWAIDSYVMPTGDGPVPYSIGNEKPPESPACDIRSLALATAYFGLMRSASACAPDRGPDQEKGQIAAARGESRVRAQWMAERRVEQRDAGGEDRRQS